MNTATAWLTKHAERRARQRGVPLGVIALVLDHADCCVDVGSGCRCFSVSRRRLRGIADDDVRPSDRERVSRVAVVVDEATGDILTVLHPEGPRGRRYRRTRKH